LHLWSELRPVPAGASAGWAHPNAFRDCQAGEETVTKKAMPSVSEQLRRAREQKNLSVYDVAEATKIKTDHVRALDDGNYDVFAAPIYIRGFIRTYAALLKLDVPRLMQELEVELSATKRFSEPPNLSAKPRSPLDWMMLQLSRVNWQWVVLISVLGLILTVATVGYRAWEHYRTTDPLADLGPGVYQSAQTNGGETLPLPAPTPAR
jgi:cytoskeletal protein RodZ